METRPESSRPLGRPRRRWECNRNEKYLKVRIGFTLLTWGGEADCCEHGNELSVSIKCEEFLG
jgi:hypothetical protein